MYQIARKPFLGFVSPFIPPIYLELHGTNVRFWPSEIKEGKQTDTTLKWALWLLQQMT